VEGVRPFEASDLEAVAGLFGALLLGRSREPAPDIVAYLRATLLDPPWRDPELPSLVYVGRGDQVVGFIGSNVRRLEGGGGPVRAVWCSHLMVAPEHRNGPAGVRLLRRLLAGPQDLTATDTASALVQQMWEALGGRADPLRSLQWMHVLRPARWLTEVALRRLAGEAPSSRLTPVAAVPFHIVGQRLAGRPVRIADPEVTSEPLSADDVLSNVDGVLGWSRLHPAYDRRYLDWLFEQMAAMPSYGELNLRLVRRREQVLGWHGAYIRRGARSRVVVVAARRREVDAVVGDVFEHARAKGAALITGRMEPHLTGALLRRLCVIGSASRCLVHARDPALVDLLLGGGGAISRMDGEWW
jgi:hypothetical protein